MESCKARVSAQNLEKLYYDEVRSELSESNRILERSEAIKVYETKAMKII